jgi:hypothetical protein
LSYLLLLSVKEQKSFVWAVLILFWKRRSKIK